MINISWRSSSYHNHVFMENDDEYRELNDVKDLCCEDVEAWHQHSQTLVLKTSHPFISCALHCYFCKSDFWLF